MVEDQVEHQNRIPRPMPLGIPRIPPRPIPPRPIPPGILPDFNAFFIFSKYPVTSFSDIFLTADLHIMHLFLSGGQKVTFLQRLLVQRQPSRGPLPDPSRDLPMCMLVGSPPLRRPLLPAGSMSRSQKPQTG
jgi:hypothetical protein